MPSLAALIQQGSTNLWLFVPTAILLGALHGLEPGHSKTLMASFIIAVRGTVAQAVLLGLCAALSHSLVVWALAALALRFGNALLAEQAEPYFMLLSALIVLGVALWMFLRTSRDNAAARAQRHAPHGGKIIDTGHGWVELEVFEQGVPPVFRLHAVAHGGAAPGAEAFDRVEVQTIRADGARQSFALVNQGAYWESTESIPEPHAVEALVALVTRGEGSHAHHYEVRFTEGGHDHGHAHGHHHGSGGDGAYQDAHERAHAEEIARRFVGQKVTNFQIALFGLTGGLVPCPASVTILLICLHLKRISLGVAMVASFSFGLALSMVGVGVIAAWGAQRVGQRMGDWEGFARKMPYCSSGLMALVGLVMGLQGLLAIVNAA